MSTVLLVEDNHAQMELIDSYLREGGHNVIQVLDAKKALEQAVENKPDIIVTDVVMPGMIGFAPVSRRKWTNFMACSRSSSDWR